MKRSFTSGGFRRSRRHSASDGAIVAPDALVAHVREVMKQTPDAEPVDVARTVALDRVEPKLALRFAAVDRRARDASTRITGYDGQGSGLRGDRFPKRMGGVLFILPLSSLAGFGALSGSRYSGTAFLSDDIALGASVTAHVVSLVLLLVVTRLAYRRPRWEMSLELATAAWFLSFTSVLAIVLTSLRVGVRSDVLFGPALVLQTATVIIGIVVGSVLARNRMRENLVRRGLASDDITLDDADRMIANAMIPIQRKRQRDLARAAATLSSSRRAAVEEVEVAVLEQLRADNRISGDDATRAISGSRSFWQ